MSRISIELVPRSYEVLQNDLETIQSQLSRVDMINIPDLTRFDIRSWEGCRFTQEYIKTTVPHIRSIDFDLEKPEIIAGYIRENNLSEVLIVNGDVPQGKTESDFFNTNSIDLIKQIRKYMPDVKVYAALDPYRSSLREEFDYVMEKIDAGAHGFFTQPFFDFKFMDLVSEQLPQTEVFWGVSPVLTDKSRKYWETRNRAFFPDTFEPTLEWNRNFANQALEYVLERNESIYFMPIRTEIDQYLKGIL